ncbi:MAG: hypothetical protein KBS55_00055 [Bacteroidales bacterium]|nr:hypothetical protein [Candidatus Cryptobacteroides aphodequi]
MQKSYCVAGHIFNVSVPEELAGSMSQYAPFECERVAYDPIFSVKVSDSLVHSDESVLYDQPTEPGETKIVLYSCAEGIIARMSPTSARPVSGEVLISPDYRSAVLHILSKEDALFALNNAIMLVFAFRTATLGTLEMHASVIKNGGKGYLFLAKSGTGKSTHSRLWLKNIPGSSLLNDDNPVVRVLEDGSVRVYGSPWSGKTPCYVNDSCPVGAFVNIHRSAENQLHPISVFEAYASVYSSSSGFKADPAMADGLHATIEAVVITVPCFTLDCRPDDEAAVVCASGVR